MVNFALTPFSQTDTGVIEGNVSDVQTGAPIAGAWVFFGPVPASGALPEWTLNADSDVPHVRTDEQGNYRIGSLRPGTYHLTVRAEGYSPAHDTVEVLAGQIVHLDFALIPYIPPRPGAIAGQVVDAETDAPIAGATIYYGPLISPEANVEWWHGEDGLLVQNVTTDEQGRYLIENLPPGMVYLMASAQGYEPARRSVEVQSDLTTVADFRLEKIVIPPPGAIEGVVRDAVTSAPLVAATVYYYHQPPPGTDPPQLNPYIDSTRPTVLNEVQTNENGVYRIPDLVPGAYVLTAAKEGYQSRSQGVEVPSGHAIEVNFALRPLSVGHGAIAGKVIDALSTQPLAGVYVWVIPDGAFTIQGAVPAVVWGEAQTDDHGEYTIDGIPAGEVRVLAAKEGYRTGKREAVVAANETTPVHFELQPIPVPATGVLVGTVREAGTEAPIAEAYVMITHDHPEDFSLSRSPDTARSTLTDKNGQYALDGLPTGSYRVTAGKFGFEPATQEAQIQEGQSTTANFLLRRIPTPEYGALGGKVIDAQTSLPLSGALVQAFPGDQEWLTRNSDLAIRTDNQGNYLFPRLRTGDYRVRAFKFGYEPTGKTATVEKDQKTTCNLALVPVPGVGTIEGMVTDALTNEPIGGALVFLPIVGEPHSANELNAPHARTDNQGHYRIEGVPAGQRTTVAFHPAYYLDAQIANVAEGQTTTLDFSLIHRPTGSWNWRVRAINALTGQPIVGARIHVPVTDWIEPGSSWDPWSGRTDETGSALILGVPPGDWSLVGSAQRFEPILTALPDATTLSAGGGLTLSDGEVVITLLFQPELALNNAACAWTLYE